MKRLMYWRWLYKILINKSLTSWWPQFLYPWIVKINFWKIKLLLLVFLIIKGSFINFSDEPLLQIIFKHFKFLYKSLIKLRLNIPFNFLSDHFLNFSGGNKSRLCLLIDQLAFWFLDYCLAARLTRRTRTWWVQGDRVARTIRTIK